MQANNPMELTKNQKDQLKELTEMVKLRALQAKCEDFKKEYENLITERSDSLNKREMLMEHITSVMEKFYNARKEEHKWQMKLEAAKQPLESDNTETLQNICLILGYTISNCHLLENNGLQLTFRYRDICYVTYNEIGQRFDLIEIFPQHPNFPQIKEFLQNSQDLRGLLCCLRKFFDFALECKEKQEQQK